MLLVAGVWTNAALADWPMWRGPLHNGVQADGARLTNSLPASGWKPVWESDTIPADKDGGFGSPVVAGGKVYLYCSWREWTDIPARLLTADAARQLGLLPTGIPDALLAEIETARTSPERSALKGPDIAKWSKAWVASRAALTQEVAVARFAEDRVSRGDKAFAPDELRRAAGLVGRKLANPDELDAWLTTNAIAGPLRERIVGLIPTRTSSMQDVILCLDAADGRTLWKRQYDGKASDWGSSSTPVVAGGTVCVAGSTGKAYGFDPLSGTPRWTNAIARQGTGINSSFVSHGNRIYIQAGRLTALDPATGATVWTQDAVGGSDVSPAIWEHAGQTYVISGGQKLSCVNAADGQVVWTAAGSQHGTPAVSGDIMAVQHGSGLIVYRLSPAGPEKLADIAGSGSRGASATTDGKRVYVAVNPKALCVDAATGTPVWTADGARDDFTSAILADGKLITLGGGGKLLLYDAATGRVLTSTKIESLQCASPALADGRLYVRTLKGVRCYDLGLTAK
jgi:outer membrane protein assembly factor BamB